MQLPFSKMVGADVWLGYHEGRRGRRATCQEAGGEAYVRGGVGLGVGVHGVGAVGEQSGSPISWAA